MRSEEAELEGRVALRRAAPGRFGAIFTDATQRLQAERAQREATERLEEMDRRKNEFLAVLSHELRNPLAPLRNSLYVLDKAAAGSERARRAQAVMERQVNHLTRLVEDLLDVSRIERGVIQLECEPLDFREVLRRSLEDYRALFAARRICLRLEGPEQPVWVNGDATRLAQAVGNLLHNAGKFTPEGGEVSVELLREPQEAALRVRDTGAGIAPEVLPRLFQPFTQADRSLDRKAGGLGLGLCVVKGIAELHGGRVGARSDGPGRGAEFTFRLPLVQEPNRAARSPAQRARSAPRRILVIEDNVDAAVSLKEALEQDAHEVALAFSGLEGLERAHTFAPAVILCDIGLPGMDGYEVARALRADPDLQGVGLVAVTGYASNEDQRKAAQAGFDWHLAKPPDLRSLEEILAELPSRGAARNEAGSA
jgi:two-component system CheB/CheR fusion protein